MKTSIPISFANSGLAINVGVARKAEFFEQDLKALLQAYDVNLETSWTSADTNLYLSNRGTNNTSDCVPLKL